MFFRKKEPEEKKDITKCVLSARRYVFSHYQNPNPPKPDPNVKYSRALIQDKEDRYDGDAIEKALRTDNPEGKAATIKMIIEQHKDKTFVELLLLYLKNSPNKDSKIYSAAQMDRRLFSKIVSDREYKPAKDTCIALALALQLPLTAAEDLLSRAGYTFSHSNKRDIIIEYCFKDNIFDLQDVNYLLYALSEKPIGR